MRTAFLEFPHKRRISEVVRKTTLGKTVCVSHFVKFLEAASKDTVQSVDRYM